jgi:hypothetical protein
MEYGIGISVLELNSIGIWFYLSDPQLSTALGVLEILFVLFGVNLILGLILYFKKKRSVLFLANSVICPTIFLASWIMWFT